MKSEQEFQVVDAKQAFLKWNALQLENIQNVLLQDAGKYIHLIPFFIQINHKILPGFVDLDTPVGVYSYVPDKKTIDDVVKLNSKFRYQPESVIKNYAVEAIYFQRDSINENNKCWVISDSELTEKKQQALKDKIIKIEKWFASKGLNIVFVVLSLSEFTESKDLALADAKKSLYLDKFYAESILLAGKYPVWWLVAPKNEKDYDNTVAHIKKARFVDVEEFLDLGRIDHYQLSDLVKYSLDAVQKMNQSPEICLVDLLVLDQKKTQYPVLDGISIRTKKQLYSNELDMNSVGVVVDIMRDTLDRYKKNKHILSPIKLFSYMQLMPGKLSAKLLSVFLEGNEVYVSSESGVDSIIMQLKFFKAISFEIRQLFENIVICKADSTSDISTDLQMVVNNMLLFLGDGESKVPIYNNKSNNDTIFNRIHLKQTSLNNNSYWDLVLGSAVEEKKIEGFNCLLGLLAWCWLNRVVNPSTQVSIDSFDMQVKQVEAYSIMETLIQKLNPNKISNISAGNFDKPAIPLLSLLFLSFIGADKSTANHESVSQSTKALLLHSEQLIVDSWGGAYTRTYSGDIGLLKCLCDWTHGIPIGEPIKPQKFNIFGHGVGDSSSMAQRTEQIFEDLKKFFYQQGYANGRFIVKLSSEYYLISAQKKLLQVTSIGSQRELIAFLELPLSEFKPLWIDSLSLSEYPLHEIYLRNKKSVVQVYFQVINKSCYVWVVDEKGSLWADVLTVYNRESFLMHWLYLFKNIRARLKQFNGKDYVLPGLEINRMSTNKLGKLEFHTVGAESLTGSKGFVDIKVSVRQKTGEDQLSLYCDEYEFLYKNEKNNVFSSCVDYLLAGIKNKGRTSIYVTDIDVPLASFNVKNTSDIQVSHLLKIKRSFEHRLNQAVEN